MLNSLEAVIANVLNLCTRDSRYVYKSSLLNRLRYSAQSQTDDKESIITMVGRQFWLEGIRQMNNRVLECHDSSPWRVKESRDYYYKIYGDPMFDDYEDYDYEFEEDGCEEEYEQLSLKFDYDAEDDYDNYVYSIGLPRC